MMKSAFELAMERLEKEDPGSKRKLTGEQKAKLEELTETYRAKIAEREVFLRGKIVAARQKGDRQEAESLEGELRSERIRLEEECEERKERIRNG